MDPGHRFKIFLRAFLQSEPIEADGRAPPALLRLGRRSAGADANFAEDMLLLYILALRVFFIRYMYRHTSVIFLGYHSDDYRRHFGGIQN